MKVIPLTQGLFAQVDDELYAQIVNFSPEGWYAELSRYTWYARCAVPGGVVYMHNLVLPPKDGFLTDHKDRDGLNNQKSNLRYATGSQNRHNSKLRKDNQYGYRGVGWHTATGKWQARIKVGGESINLGYFSSLIKAVEAYNVASKLHFGEFAFQNEVPIEDKFPWEMNNRQNAPTTS